MTAPVPTDPAAAIAVELAHLRDAFGQVGRDLNEVKTSTAVLVERSTRADADLQRVREDSRTDIERVARDAARELGETRTEVAVLRSEVESLKRWRWVVTGGACTVGAAAGAVASLLGH